MGIWKELKLNPANARGFFFFLLLTTILAALIKMSKTYSVNRTIAVEIVDLPLNRAIQTMTPSEFVVKAKVSGFSIVRNSLKNIVLQIPFEDITSTKEGYFEYEIGDHMPAIQGLIAKDASVDAIKPKRIRIKLDSLSSKRVAVLPKTSIEYAVGFNASSSIQVAPDSITIVGPSEILKEITSIKTKEVKIKDAKKDVRVSVGIEVDTLEMNLKFSQTQVNIMQSVTKFTEGTVTVPVTVLNDPTHKVKILPKNVTVVYKVALDSFDSVGPSDFHVTCDFNKATVASNYLSLQVDRKPPVVQGVRLSTKQVKFIVIK